MTDGVSDEQFEAALAEAKREGNLSRANVARKTRHLRDERLNREQPGTRIHTGSATGPEGRLDSNRIVQVTADTLEGLSPGPNWWTWLRSTKQRCLPG
jgi:hypothetical protein